MKPDAPAPTLRDVGLAQGCTTSYGCETTVSETFF
jgi:hypothetical protein